MRTSESIRAIREQASDKSEALAVEWPSGLAAPGSEPREVQVESGHKTTPTSLATPIVSADEQSMPSTLGRYVVGPKLASGGMATVYGGLLEGAEGFRRPVAIKRLHSHLAEDESSRNRFVAEAHTASRVRHANVVQTLDAISKSGELYIVMEYVSGLTVAEMLRAHITETGTTVPRPIAIAIMVGALRGLQAVHTATSEDGASLGLVHRDVSPQNIMVGADGTPRLLDFGIARAYLGTHGGDSAPLLGKCAYMAPEQVMGEPLDARTDVFAAGIVLWEMLAGRGLFRGGGSDGAAIQRVLNQRIPPPIEQNQATQPLLDVVMTALSRNAWRRFQSAQDFLQALDALQMAASPEQVAQFVRGFGGVRAEPSVEVGGGRSNAALEERDGEEREERDGEEREERDGEEREEREERDGEERDGEEREERDGEEAGGSSNVTVSSIPIPSRPVESRWRVPIVALITVLVGLGTTFVLFEGAGRFFGTERDRVAQPTTRQSELEIEGRRAEMEPVQASTAPVSGKSNQPSQVFETSPAKPPGGSEQRGSAERVSSGATQDKQVPQPSTKPQASTKSARSAIRASTQKRPSRPTSSKGATATKCNPPTYLDGEGILHYKKECL